MFVAWPGGDPKFSLQKGGDAVWHVFKILFTGMFPKEKMISLLIKNTTDSRRANRLIRAADWVRERGQVHPISEDPTTEESIGILFNIIRRRKKISLEKLAYRSGFAIEELIAFEAGLLPRFRMCKMLPEIAKEIKIDHTALLRQLQSYTPPRFSK